MKTDEKQQIETTDNSMQEEEKIDIAEIIKTLWGGRKTLIISILIGSAFGLFVAITTPKEYTVSTVMVPQTSGGSKSQLSGLASLAGIDLGMTQSSEMSPIIYPKIVNSVPFKLELMKEPLHFSGISKPVSLLDYYTKFSKPSPLDYIKQYTFGLPGIIIGALKKETKEKVSPTTSQDKKIPLHLTKAEYVVKRILDKKISLVVEKKEGYLTLIVRLNEPLATAELAQKAQELLQRYITEFKVEKSKADLIFIQERYDVAKAEAEKFQVNVAVNTDRFKNLTSSLPQVSTTRMQSKYNIANNVFLDLAKQLEQAKIQVKKDTPVFTIVEPVTIPSIKSKPSRPMILFSWIIFSVVIGIGIIYGKIVLKGFKQKINETGSIFKS